MVLTTSNLLLRNPTAEDGAELIDLHTRNQQHWLSWEPKVESYATYAVNLRNWLKENEEKKSERFFIFKKDQPDHLIGYCNFTQIFRGAFQACYLGYKIDKEFEGKGFMHEALQASIRYIFEGLRLHRIMANYMPVNVRSAKLLERLGFEKEGYAKQYLLINGKWEDHVLTALTIEKWQLI